jgi:hypothetical protein
MIGALMSQSRQFRFNKGFKPLPLEEGEEFFCNGIFEFNITKLSAFIGANSDRFVEEHVELTSPALSFSGELNDQTVETARVQKPVILAEISPGRFNLIDGHHRVAKARRLGLQSIPAYRVKAEDHLAFLTSVDAYTKYVGYWNRKLSEES